MNEAAAPKWLGKGGSRTLGGMIDFSYVYLIGPEGHRGPCKIGISNRPENRVKQLQTAHPRPVAVHASWQHLNPRAVEAEAHRLLAPWQMSGEWFDVSLNRAIVAVVRAISHVDSNYGCEFARYTLNTLASMRDVIMLNTTRTSGRETDEFRVGYSRHISSSDQGLDLACQVAWLTACGVRDEEIYIETDPKENSALKNVFRELRPGDRFCVLSRAVLGGKNYEEALLKIAKEHGITIQLIDEIVSYADNETTEVA